LTEPPRAAYGADMTAVPTSRELIDELIALLQLRQQDDDVFAGPPTPPALRNGGNRLFGGQVIAQALLAAEATVGEDRAPHSLHAYFLRMGRDDVPIRYQVSRDFDGGSFTNRRVVAYQESDGKDQRLLLNLTASFHRREDGFEHQDAMPDVPTPETLQNDREVLREKLTEHPQHRDSPLLSPRPLDQRTVQARNLFEPVPMAPDVHTWTRTAAPIGDDPRLHRAILAYASDFVMLPTASRPHGQSWFLGEVQEASLDHAIWFHDDFRADEWLLFATHSSRASRARGTTTGRVFTRDGRLVASLAQEGLMRMPKAG
jgi:acyl-CoA thioesterase-2